MYNEQNTKINTGSLLLILPFALGSNIIIIDPGPLSLNSINYNYYFLSKSPFLPSEWHDCHHLSECKQPEGVI